MHLNKHTRDYCCESTHISHSAHMNFYAGTSSGQHNAKPQESRKMQSGLLCGCTVACETNKTIKWEIIKWDTGKRIEGRHPLSVGGWVCVCSNLTNTQQGHRVEVIYIWHIVPIPILSTPCDIFIKETNELSPSCFVTTNVGLVFCQVRQQSSTPALQLASSAAPDWGYPCAIKCSWQWVAK